MSKWITIFNVKVHNHKSKCTNLSLFHVFGESLIYSKNMVLDIKDCVCKSGFQVICNILALLFRHHLNHLFIKQIAMYAYYLLFYGALATCTCTWTSCLPLPWSHSCNIINTVQGFFLCAIRCNVCWYLLFSICHSYSDINIVKHFRIN